MEKRDILGLIDEDEDVGITIEPERKDTVKDPVKDTVRNTLKTLSGNEAKICELVRENPDKGGHWEVVE